MNFTKILSLIFLFLLSGAHASEIRVSSQDMMRTQRCACCDKMHIPGVMFLEKMSNLETFEKLNPLERELPLVGKTLSSDKSVIERLLNLRPSLEKMWLDNDEGLLEFEELNQGFTLPNFAEIKIAQVKGKVDGNTVFLPWLTMFPGLKNIKLRNGDVNETKGINELSNCLFSMLKELRSLRVEYFSLQYPEKKIKRIKTFWAGGAITTLEALQFFPNIKAFGPGPIRSDELTVLPKDLKCFTIDESAFQTTDCNLLEFLVKIKNQAKKILLQNASMKKYHFKDFENLTDVMFENCFIETNSILPKLPPYIQLIVFIKGKNSTSDIASYGAIFNLVKNLGSLEKIYFVGDYFRNGSIDIIQKKLSKEFGKRNITIIEVESSSYREMTAFS